MQRLPYVLLLAITAIATANAQATRADTVRGRVTTDSGAAIPGATIAVTMAPSAESFTTSSDSSGAYAIAILNGSGEYILYIGAPGRRPLRRRLTRTGGDTTFVIDAQLASSAPATLAAVEVEARRQRPQRALASTFGFGTDATDKTVDGLQGVLPPELQGDIDAMAALVPGLTMTGAGPSAFGVGGDANAAQLNGVSFSGASVPRDMNTSTRFMTSPWDVTRGGFSGVWSSTSINPGSNVSQRRARISFDHPALQTSDAVSRRFGQTHTNVLAGFGGDGPLRLDEYYYNVGAQLSHRHADAGSLLDMDAEALAHAGISSDSAARLMQLLGAAQVPLGASLPGSRTVTNASLMARFDRQLPQGPPTAMPKPLTSAVVYANHTRSRAYTLSPVAPPTRSGERTSTAAGLQGMYSRYFGKEGSVVNEMTSALTWSADESEPYLPLPGANVTIASTLPDGQNAIGNLSFGGNSALASSSTRLGWEAVNQTGFLIKGKASLPVQIYLQSRLERFAQQSPANMLGTFSFESLDDVAAARPTSFSRTLGAPEASGSQWIGAAALGAMWNTRKMRIIGGVRLDGNEYLTAPVFNADVQQRFGARTDVTPSGIGISPRLGLYWYYRNTGAGTSYSVTGYSTRSYGGPQVRAGIGMFRSALSTSLVSDALITNDPNGGGARLLCIGNETPTPDWSAYASNPLSIPSTCADGSTTFADTARNVSLFHPHYDPPTSLRASIGWTGTILKTYFTIDAGYSLNRHQPGVVDLNFVGVQQFVLPNEGNRPVFVPESDIEPASGVVSAVASRRSASYGRVTQRVSDLEAVSRQVTVYAIPNLPFRAGVYSVFYSIGDAHGDARGFDLGTGTDPRIVERAPLAFTPRHQFGVQGGKFFFQKVWLSAFVRATSGIRYTPAVAADVNGDGTSGDRAFVFDPAAVADASLAAGLDDLMRSAPSRGRRCLLSQRGRLAARHSCVGPWTVSMMTTLFITPYIPRTNERARIALSLANPLTGIDLLLHGRDGLRGWGSGALPDPTLYHVTGFNATEDRFEYRVNPRFGSNSPSTTTLRAPFRATLELSFRLGRSPSEQRLEQRLRITPARVGTRASADTIKARYSRNFQDIYGILVRLADSLALSREQLEQIEVRRGIMRARGDSLYGALAKEFAELQQDYDVKAALKREQAADSVNWQYNYDERPFLQALLTPGQIRLLPSPLMQMVMDPKFRGRFFGF